MPDSREYLYRIQPTSPDMLRSGPTAPEEAAISEHFTYLKELTERGVVILAGRTLTADETSFGIVVFRAGSDDIARDTMEDDPAVRSGVMRARLYPFRVALSAPRSGP